MWQSGMCAPVLMLSSAHAGHYRALEWSESEQKYVENSNLGILVEVDVSLVAVPPVSAHPPNPLRNFLTRS